MSEVEAKASPKRWEYYFHPKEIETLTSWEKLQSVPYVGFESDINDLGRSGWEMVCALPLAVGYGQTSKVVFVFKRPIG